MSVTASPLGDCHARAAGRCCSRGQGESRAAAGCPPHSLGLPQGRQERGALREMPRWACVRPACLLHVGMATAARPGIVSVPKGWRPGRAWWASAPGHPQDSGQDVGQEGLSSEGPTTSDLLPNIHDCRWDQLVGHAQSCDADLPNTAFPSKAGWKRDVTGGPAVKSPGSQCRRHRFDSWSGNQDPTGHIT